MKFILREVTTFLQKGYIIPSDMLPGYIFAVTPQGNRALRIKDAEHAEAFQSIPSSSNRDLLGIEITARMRQA
jgi:hypothetical protein